MFTLDPTIDLIQNGKKTFVSTVFANNSTIAEALNGFVDAQTEYTKKAVKAGTDSATKVTSEVVKMTEEALRFNPAKVFEDFNKSFSTKK
jgi:hypothetical protein